MDEISYTESESEWVNYSTYYLSNIPQSDKERFLPLRIGRITGTTSSLVAGHTLYSGSGTPGDTLKKICGQEDVLKRTEIELQRLRFGNFFEPVIRKWYIDTYKIPVKEIGFAVWKENEQIGCSADGDIGDGIIEIKCTMEELSSPLMFQAKFGNKSEMAKGRNFSHIPRSHFDQMQHNIKILDKKYCDYIVFSPKKIYVERIPKLEDYFDSILMPKYTAFIDTHLNPYIQANNIQIIKVKK